jgi:hypothetical protein
MIEKLIADRFLNLQGFDQSPPPVDPTFPPNFVPALGRIYHIERSVSVGPPHDQVTTSQIRVGAHPDPDEAHRTFRWLPWVPGKVSCVPLAGSDILTGPMTGCWLVIFEHRNDGQLYAGHIGTETDLMSANTRQARAAWRDAVTNDQIVHQHAFNPVGPNLPAFNTLNLGPEAAEFYGAFSENATVHTVVFALPHEGNAKRIASVVPMETSLDVTGF